MRIQFCEPPASQRVGGLDLAIRSLESYLEANHFTVFTHPPGNAEVIPPVVTHFHGLWQLRHFRQSRRCLQKRIPYVVSPHGMLEPWAWRHKWWKKLPYYQLIEKRHLQDAHTVLATSQPEARNLARFVPPSKITTIPLGIPTAHQQDYPGARTRLGWGPEDLVLLYLSRLHPKKGLHLLLQALGPLVPSLPSAWRLLVVGDGDPGYLAACRALVNSQPALASHIVWRGAVWGEQKWDYYRGADLFCLPTFSENFGLAVLEAAQVGTRVLTTPYTPWAYLEQHRSAFVVEPEIRSITSGLQNFLKNRNWGVMDRQLLSHLVHDQFGWARVGKQYLDLYHSLAAINSNAC